MQAAAHPAYFGLVIPGRPVVTEFEPVGATKLVATVPNPGDAGEVVFFLLAGAPLGASTSAVLYYTVDGVAWSVIGAVSADKPSGVFKTPWSEQLAGGAVVQVGVSIEPTDSVANLQLAGSGVDERRAFARKIAQDLFTFLASFATTAHHAEQLRLQQHASDLLVVPTNVLDRWITRFDAKYERDPNFYLK
mmetsp:Transcript_8688/g.27291  ORF Transcript_8688/g.27291 Transcript_8688/m.27291 type:complete len:191 (+) Transcript_8688:219-791(+)